MTAPIKPPGNGAADAARGLEAYMLRQMLAEARTSGGGLVDGGFAGDTFKDMLDSALADAMAKAGGVGLARMLAKPLGIDPSELAAPQRFSGLRPDPAGPDADLTRAAVAHPDLARGEPPTDRPFAMPVHGRLSSGFGDRVDPITHTHIPHPGLDIAAREGTPVGAAAAGKVVRAGAAGTYGNLVVIRHPDGLETRYAHLSAVTVREGDHVDTGDAVGLVGHTGRATGPHLHFEVRKDGVARDPRPELNLDPPLNSRSSRTNR